MALALSSRCQDSSFSTCPVVLGADGGRVTSAASPCPQPALPSALVSCLPSTATVSGGIEWDGADGSDPPLWAVVTPGATSVLTPVFWCHVYSKDTCVPRDVFQSLCFICGIVMCQNTQEQSGNRPYLHHLPLPIAHDWDSLPPSTHTRMLFLTQPLTLLKFHWKIYLLTLSPLSSQCPADSFWLSPA